MTGDDWRNILGNMMHGIYLLTTSGEEEINGMIVSWVSPVSYEPPLIMAAVHPNRYTYHLIEQSGFFALHILYRNQIDLLGRFKRPNPKDKFESIEWNRGQWSCPILKECIGYMECRVRDRYAPGNHTLFIGDVLKARVFSSDEPLSTLDYEGVYLGKK